MPLLDGVSGLRKAHEQVFENDQTVARMLEDQVIWIGQKRLRDWSAQRRHELHPSSEKTHQPFLISGQPAG